MAAIEAVAEEIAENLEEAAAVTRGINGKSVGLVLGGALVGAAVGFYFGYRFNREKIRAEAFKESEAEVDKIREVYMQKTVAAQEKPTIEEVIEERGYSTKIDTSVVGPPGPGERPLKPPVPIHEPLTVIPEPKSKDFGWDYPTELAARTPEVPYIIHQDEFRESVDGYSQVTYTYYAGDDVLVDTDERPLPHADIIVGQGNLRWGHGADDIDVVFVRNEKLELDMEICRSPKSYEEEVLGLEHDEQN